MIVTILKTVLGLILLLFIGFLCSKVGLIDEAAEKKLTGLLLKVVQPVYLFMAYQRAFDRGMLRDFLVCMAMAAAAFLVMILIPYFFFRKGSRDREVGLVVSAFPNTGFFGIPLIAGIYGTEGVFFLTTMITMFNVLVWTYGIIVMSGRRDSLRNTVKRLMSPALLSVVVGLVCFSAGLLLPDMIASPLNKLGDMNTPLAMLISGAVVARADFRQGLKDAMVYKISFLRMLLLPAAVALLLFWLPVDPMLITIVVLAAGFPVGSIPLMFCVQYDKNSVLAGECMALTVALCCATTPLIYLLLNFLMGAM
ncbi:MAG: AEC family transporter [Clostridia bacterium]|nr:AEC family transporter [Clostridia bacterium]